jgi:hypothetical protein
MYGSTSQSALWIAKPWTDQCFFCFFQHSGFVAFIVLSLITSSKRTKSKKVLFCLIEKKGKKKKSLDHARKQPKKLRIM